MSLNTRPEIGQQIVITQPLYNLPAGTIGKVTVPLVFHMPYGNNPCCVVEISEDKFVRIVPHDAADLLHEEELGNKHKHRLAESKIK